MNMVTYGKFEKMHLTGTWFCVRRPWSDATTECSGFDYVRDNDLIAAYPEWQAEDVIQHFTEVGA